jgi:hypothetical protein
MYYKVVVETGSCSVSDRSVMEERCTCGHKHKTRDTAERCMDKLTKRDQMGNCSALWYNSVIHNQDQQRA